MITRKGIALAAMLLTLSLSAPLMAQRTGGGGGQRGGPVDYSPKPKSQAELDAYQALVKDPNPATKLSGADAFLTTYPNTDLVGFVQRLRIDALMRLGKPKDAISAAETGLAFETKFLENLIKKADDQAEAAKDPKNKNAKVDKNAPPQQIIDKNSEAFKKFGSDTENDLMVYYQALMAGYQQLNDAAKVIEWGEKAVMQKPDDLGTLLTLSTAMARPPADQAKAEEYGKQAVAQLDIFLATPMGSQLAPAQKADIVSGAHDTLGRIYINTKRFSDAEKEYTLAIKAKKDDGDAYYFLGYALAQQTPPRGEEAMDAFAKAVFLKGATAAQATDVLKQMYQNVHHDLVGLDDFIKAAGAKIGK